VGQNNPDPSTTSTKYYRQQNTISNSCAFVVDINQIKIRARSLCATCVRPMKLLKLQFITSGTFSNETSNIVYAAAVGGDSVSTTQTDTINLGTPLSIPASSSSAKYRFIFSTITPVWAALPTAKKSVMEADFAFAQQGALCTPSSITNIRLEAPPP